MSSDRPSPHLRQFVPIKYKKAPQAPRRFKSSYMFFSTSKHKEIRAELARKGEDNVSTTNVAKMVSRAWKKLSDDEREKWEEMARQDKVRYEMEKSIYTGPWKVPAKQRVAKDPACPKRPMSAFLSYSNSKRSSVKSEHKNTKNAEISKILAQMWKKADPVEKQVYIDEEFRLRQQYKNAMSEWKKKNDLKMQSKRVERENMALKAVREGKKSGGSRNSNNFDGTDSTFPAAATAAVANPFADFATTVSGSPFDGMNYGSRMLPVDPFDRFMSNSSQQNQFTPNSPQSYSNDEYNQQQYLASASTSSSVFNFDPVQSSSTSPSAMEAAAALSSSYSSAQPNSYVNPYATAQRSFSLNAPSTGGGSILNMSGGYNAPSLHDNGRFDVTTGSHGTAPGYETYRQIHSYGYIPPSPYYHRGGAYAADGRPQPLTQPHHQRYQYDPNQFKSKQQNEN